jgi:hypothetical protein
MSHPQPPALAKLVTGMFMRRRELFGQAAVELVASFGDVDIVSSWMPFDYTRYYRKEMGEPLYRRMIVFSRLIGQDELSAVKLETNALEDRFRRQNNRQINIDPGYLLRERFVLASGKNFSHRIYIGRGIYADLTLIYRHGKFETLPWTYPDYADTPMTSFLSHVRAKYALDLNQQN